MRSVLLSVAAPVLLAAMFEDPGETVTVRDPAVTEDQERSELIARCRSLIAMFDQAAGVRPDSDELEAALRLRSTAADECSDPRSPSLVENGIEDLGVALHIIGADE